jgi:hypothetical protein
VKFSQKKLAAANQLAYQLAAAPAASSQQLAVAHPIIQPVHATEDVTKPLPINGLEEHGGDSGFNADGITMLVEDVEHFISAEHDGVHGVALPFLFA